MVRIAITQLAGVGLLIIGIVIGAGFVFAANSAAGSPNTSTVTLTLPRAQTTTQTSTETLISTQTLSTATLVLTQTSTVTIIRSTTAPYAQLSASVITCSRSGNGTDYCAIILTNSGTAGAGLTGCHLTISGSSTTGRLTGQTTVPAGAQSTADCSAMGPAQTSGSQASGFFGLNDGSTLPFSGTWS